MSSKRGNLMRTRPQKYKNRTAFRNDLHDKTVQIKKINSIQVYGVCDRCKDVIEWKIKYKKYKLLSQPKTCIKCGLRNVKKSYHTTCNDCVKKLKACAKCGRNAEEVNIIEGEPIEEKKANQIEIENMLKSLPERKRRAFKRYLLKLEKKTDDKPDDVTRDKEIAEKFKSFNLNGDDDYDDDDNFDSDFDDDDDEED